MDAKVREAMRVVLEQAWRTNHDHDWGPQTDICAFCRETVLQLTPFKERKHAPDCPLVALARALTAKEP